MAHRGLVKICAVVLILFTGVTFYLRLTMECSAFRKNSAHFERVYNEAQDEVAEWRRKYDAEYARAEECNTNIRRDLQQKTEELNVALAQLASAEKDNQEHVDEILKLNADLTQAREGQVKGVDTVTHEEVSQHEELHREDR